jgi:hypothetical protein
VELIFSNLVLVSGLPSAARVLNWFHERDGHKRLLSISVGLKPKLGS